MSTHQTEHIFKARKHDVVQFLFRILVSAPTKLEELRFFKRDLESERDIVGDVGRSDREDLKRDRYPFFVNDDRKCLCADVGEHTPRHFLCFGQRDEGCGDRRCTGIDGFDPRFLYGTDHVI